jgi:hypothetical protein
MFMIVLNYCSKVFKEATMFFLQGQSNVDSIIPAMDYLDQQPTTSALNMRYSKAIMAVINIGKKMLN